MHAQVNLVCFAASYAIALGLELAQLRVPEAWRRGLLVIAGAAGLVAQTWYLGVRAATYPLAPLASQHDWFLLAAWSLAVIYLAAKFYYPRVSLGVFLLPAVLALIGGAWFADPAPLASFQAPRVWGRIHGYLLVVGSVAVLLGFLAGLMYLIQSYRLKHKLPITRLRLPSLEWLERVNSRALGAATVFVTAGFLTGVLTRLAAEGENLLPWNDPVVLSLALMTLWLVVAEVFRMVYPAARRGQKVAYLTIAAFWFLVMVLVVMTARDTLHQQAELAQPALAEGAEP